MSLLIENIKSPLFIVLIPSKYQQITWTVSETHGLGSMFLSSL